MNPRDFVSTRPVLKGDSQTTNENNSTPGSYPYLQNNLPSNPMMNFQQPQFPNPMNFMNVPPQGGMFYQSYPNQYMDYNYNMMQYPYKKNKPFQKKPYGQKNYSSGVNKKIYALKPKPALKPEENTLAEDFKLLTIKENKEKTETTGDNLQKSPSELKNAKFFVIKSYSEEDVFQAIKFNLWCSTREGNVKLHNAFVTANNEYPIFLLFSVNSSGHFIGIAQMKSSVDFEKNFVGWKQTTKWKGVFSISWIYLKDISNKELRHLQNPLNEGKPVPNSRDTQEIPFEVGLEVLKIFETSRTQTSILDDFEYYEESLKKKERGSNSFQNYVQ